MQATEYIFFRKNNFLEFPKVLQIEITNKCPLNCPQCYKDVSNYKNMDYSLLEKTINEAAEIGVKRIMINGGEPLMYPQLEEAILLMNKKDILPTCYSSGAGMTERFAGRLKNLNIEFLLSFNGSNEKINSLSRDGFEVTLKAAKILKNNDVKFGVNWVARNDNIADFPQMIQFAREIGAEYIIIVCNKITNSYEVDSSLSLEDFDFLSKIIGEADNEKFINIQNCNNILAVYSYEMPNSRLYGCPAGVTSLCMNVEGAYIPCSHLYFPEKFTSIKEYWDNSKYLNRLRDNPTNKIDHCRECKRNSRCRFCRAMTPETHLDFNKGYENCPIFLS